MYCLTVFNGVPPTVDTKYEFVHSVGSRLFSHGIRHAIIGMTCL